MDPRPRICSFETPFPADCQLSFPFLTGRRHGCGAVKLRTKKDNFAGNSGEKLRCFFHSTDHNMASAKGTRVLQTNPKKFIFSSIGPSRFKKSTSIYIPVVLIIQPHNGSVAVAPTKGDIRVLSAPKGKSLVHRSLEMAFYEAYSITGFMFPVEVACSDHSLRKPQELVPGYQRCSFARIPNPDQMKPMAVSLKVNPDPHCPPPGVKGPIGLSAFSLLSA